MRSLTCFSVRCKTERVEGKRDKGGDASYLAYVQLRVGERNDSHTVKVAEGCRQHSVASFTAKSPSSLSRDLALGLAWGLVTSKG